MSNRFVYSDPHWGHANIRFVPGNEQFVDMTSEERDDVIVDNWNHVVGKRDIVYLLGDIGMDKKGYVTHGVIPRLNGRIHVVGGNHDNPEILHATAEKNSRNVCAVNGVLTASVNGWSIVMTHIPIHPQEMWWDYNVHGHLHFGTIKKHATHPDHRFIGPNDPRYICVCGEHLGFTPRPIEDVVPGKEGTPTNVTVRGYKH